MNNQVVPEGKINIQIHPQNQTIQIIDNGIGMTEEEVEKYISQLAFSGAKEFVEKIKKEEKEISKNRADFKEGKVEKNPEYFNANSLF